MAHFRFLQPEWPEIFIAAGKAEPSPSPTLAPPASTPAARSNLLSPGSTPTMPGCEAVSGQPQRAYLRTRLSQPYRREAFRQNSHYQRSRQPRRSQRETASPVGRHLRGSGALSFLLLVRPDLRADATRKPSPALTFDAARLPQTSPVPRKPLEQPQSSKRNSKPATKRSSDSEPLAPPQTRNSRGCARKSPKPGPATPRSPIPTTTPKPRPATTLSISCSEGSRMAARPEPDATARFEVSGMPNAAR